MRTFFIETYLHFMKNCIRPHYEKLKSLKSGFIENSIFENNRDPWRGGVLQLRILDAMCTVYIREQIFQGEKVPRPRWIFVSFLVIHSLQEWECRFAEKGWAWEYVEEDSLESLDVLI